jgi:signal transduction histidine kinase
MSVKSYHRFSVFVFPVIRVANSEPVPFSTHGSVYAQFAQNHRSIAAVSTKLSVWVTDQRSYRIASYDARRSLQCFLYRCKLGRSAKLSRVLGKDTLATAPNIIDSGMELEDLLTDQAFLDRRDNSDRAQKRFEALQALAHVFAEAPEVVLQKLVDIAVEYCGADSAGISLLEDNGQGDPKFRWIAISGTFSKYIHGTTPRFFSPCGTCISSGRPQHYRVTKPYYDFLGVTAEPITDGILIPWTSDQSTGTIWAVSHGSRETFNPEDYKLLNALADFAGISVRLAERQQLLQQSHRELESQVEQRTSSLRLLSAHLMRVQDEERRKIARELHDSVGQYLVALKMNLAQMMELLPGGDAQVLADSEQMVDQCLAETRTISHLLHPPLLDESGLPSAAKWYLEGFSKRSGIEVSLDIHDNLGRLPQDIETALFRVLQECLTNVHRHSGSKKVDVELRLDDGEALVSIRDYGCGFTSRQLRDVRNGHSRGVGLTGLRERVAVLGGLLEVASTEPGALVKVTLPLSLKREP